MLVHKRSLHNSLLIFANLLLLSTGVVLLVLVIVHYYRFTFNSLERVGDS